MWFTGRELEMNRLSESMQDYRRDYQKLVAEVWILQERLKLPIPTCTGSTHSVPLDKAVQAILTHLNLELERVPAAEETVRVRQK